MDDDYGDIPDEDMILAFSQVTEAICPPATNSTNSRTGYQNTSSRVATISGPSRPSINGLSNTFGARTGGPTAPRDLQIRPPGLATAINRRAGSQSQNFRQTTLWGEALRVDDQPLHQPANNRPYVADLPPEAPTHHALEPGSLSEWIYPTNLGAVRDYQFSIVKHGLFNNTLVALPTGLGKTFIAATVMLNFYRWTKSAKLVFVAPTKPLVAQQVDACLNVAGIPRSQTTRLDGDVPPVVREGEWERKRLFFMTPQTLMNDLSKGYADPKSIVLLVVDEAHRATGDYAYVKVVSFLRRFSKSFRVLALTATPGSTVEAVQDVINHLGINHVEIRTEESLDIREYVHSRNIEAVILEPSDEILRVRELFSKALKPLVDKLSSQNIYWGRDPMALTTYGLVRARSDWMSGPGRHVNQGTKFMMFAIFSILQSLAHAIKLLNFHGIRPFYNNVADFRSNTEDKGESGSKYKRQILNDPSFQEMMATIDKWQRLDGFVGHPKMTYLCDTLLNHFMDAGEGSSTRAIVFSEYRDSAEEIVRVLNTHRPLTKAAVFVGQADSKRSEGMKQKQQIETIEKFKSGVFNVLVATSIGEEGLDIGQVDLIVCYDASASPIRMLQRMGRTGRKRAGNIVLLLMKGKEEDQFAKARDNYSHIQKLICDGSHFSLCHDLSSRIIPRDIRPEVNKCIVDIPFENTQARDLLDPKKTAAALRKKPSKKKFHMPDGVETGFTKASTIAGMFAKPKPPEPLETDFLAENPGLQDVLLSDRETSQLKKSYRDLPKQDSPGEEEIGAPDLTAFPAAQRSLRPTVKLKHGEYTRRCVKLLAKLARAESFTLPIKSGDKDGWKEVSILPFVDESGRDLDESPTTTPSRKRPRPHHPLDDDDGDDNVFALETPAKRRDPKGAAVRRKSPSSLVLHEPEDGDEDKTDGEDEIESQDEESDGSRKERTNYGRTTTKPGRGGTRGGRAKTTAGPGRGRKAAPRCPNRLKRSGDHIEDLGDDCERSSDIEETDGSDSGADLVDFVVGDDEITSSMMRSHISTSPTSPPTPPQPQPRGRGKRGGRGQTGSASQPVNLPQTQESDDMPDLDTLVNKGEKGPERGKRKPALFDILGDDDGGGDDGRQDFASGVQKVSSNKRRRPVVSSSDDE